jgi:Na+/H+ antiporter NhaA
MVAGKNKVENLYIREGSAFSYTELSPACFAGFNVIPVFACHNAGVAAHASILVEVKCHLFSHGLILPTPSRF